MSATGEPRRALERHRADRSGREPGSAISTAPSRSVWSAPSPAITPSTATSRQRAGARTVSIVAPSVDTTIRKLNDSLSAAVDHSTRLGRNNRNARLPSAGNAP